MTKVVFVGEPHELVRFKALRQCWNGSRPDLVVIDEVQTQLTREALTMTNSDPTLPIDPNLVENTPRRAMGSSAVARRAMSLLALLSTGGLPNGLLSPVRPLPMPQDPAEKAAKLSAAEAKRARKNRARLGL